MPKFSDNRRQRSQESALDRALKELEALDFDLANKQLKVAAAEVEPGTTVSFLNEHGVIRSGYIQHVNGDRCVVKCAQFEQPIVVSAEQIRQAAAIRNSAIDRDAVRADVADARVRADLHVVNEVARSDGSYLARVAFTRSKGTPTRDELSTLLGDDVTIRTFTINASGNTADVVGSLESSSDHTALVQRLAADFTQAVDDQRLTVDQLEAAIFHTAQEQLRDPQAAKDVTHQTLQAMREHFAGPDLSYQASKSEERWELTNNPTHEDYMRNAACGVCGSTERMPDGSCEGCAKHADGVRERADQLSKSSAKEERKDQYSHASKSAKAEFERLSFFQRGSTVCIAAKMKNQERVSDWGLRIQFRAWVDRELQKLDNGVYPLLRGGMRLQIDRAANRARAVVPVGRTRTGLPMNNDTDDFDPLLGA